MPKHLIELRPGLGRPAYDIERDVWNYADEADSSRETQLGLACFGFHIYRAWGSSGARSYSPDFGRGDGSDDPDFGNGWVISLLPYDEGIAAALGPHVMFVADQHLEEDREGHLGAAAVAMNAYARRFTTPSRPQRLAVRDGQIVHLPDPE